MEKTLRYIITAVLVFVTVLAAGARNFGEGQFDMPTRYRVEGTKKLNVRNSPSTTKTKVVDQVSAGDYLYPIGICSNDGRYWFELGNGKYVAVPEDGASTLVYEEENPYYSDPALAATAVSVVKTQKIGKIVLLVLWGVAAIFGLVLLMGYYADSYKDYDWFLGRRRKGMRMVFFRNKEPYLFVLYLALIILAAAVASLLAMLLIGGTVFVLLWVVKILALAFLWIGIIGCVIGIIMTICGAFYGIILAIIGGIIWHYDDAIEGFAEACAQAGLSFFNEFNVIDFAKELVIQYWPMALMVAAVPIVLLLALAILWFIFAQGLILYERSQTARYNIKHPCPKCHQPSEPAEYLSEGIPFPEGVHLRPGPYGMFSMTHPDTGEVMPTLISRGRDLLTRRCANCGAIIAAKEGIERHVIFVGAPDAGKSTLAYRLVATLIKRGSLNKKAVDFTDAMRTIKDYRTVIEKINHIVSDNAVLKTDTYDSFPGKTDTGAMTSMQLLIPSGDSVYPYKLYLNDMAGEHFADLASGRVSDEKHNLFHYANAIVILVDPLNMEFPNASDDMQKWLDEHIEDKDTERLDPLNLRNAVANAMKSAGVDPSEVSVDFVLVKRDLGYIPEDVVTEQDVERFMRTELGMSNVLTWAEIKNLHFYAVSAAAEGDASHMDGFIDGLLSQLKIKF